MKPPHNVIFSDLGNMDFRQAWDYQEVLLQQNVEVKAALRQRQVLTTAGDEASMPELVTQDHLLFVEHPPVYTLGKSGHEENLLITQEQRQAAGIGYYRINRGGDITFHGPGQLVGYPILDLEKWYTDIGRYLRNIEEVIILTLAEYGLQGHRSPGETGVWLDPHIKGKERKICAIGIRCSRWVTMHGFAFNVNTDLAYFGHIIPCGIRDKEVTSLRRELGRSIPMEEVKEKVKRNFEKVFEAALRTPLG